MTSLIPWIDSLVAVPDAAQELAAPASPSLAGAIVRTVLLVALIACAGWGWVRWQRRLRGPDCRLEVLERAGLARGVSVALVRAEGRRLLVGVSAEGVRLLRDLDAGRPPVPETVARMARPAVEPRARRRPRFPALLSEIRRRREDS